MYTKSKKIIESL